MEELVEFTLILKQLDDNELIQFLSESLKKYGHSLFGKLFFNYFMHRCHRTEIKDHTQCLMDIINARENKPNRSASHLRIDKLPSALIAECASYLPLNEYVRLSRTNRQMFVSTNKPFTLYELPCSAFRKYPQTMSMHKFKSVKSLCIDIEQFNQTLSTSNQSIWKHSSFDKVQLWNKSNDETNTTLFLDKNAINVDGIGTLDLFDFGNLEQGHHHKQFTAVLGRFRNVKHLSLREIYLSAFQYNDRDKSAIAKRELSIAKWFPNLTSLYVSTACRYTMLLVTLIVNAVGHRLESLTIPEDYASELHCNFSNLKELEFECCDTTNPQCLTPFVKVTTLQSMSMESENENMLKSCIDFMLKKQTSIKQMKIVTETKCLKCISDEIQKALFESHYQGTRRDSLFFFLECSDALSSDIVPTFEVFKLLSSLTHVHVTDFMIRINLVGTKEEEKIKQLASEFDKMKDDYLVYCYDNVFTVGNKTCKINGLMWRRLFH
eukprot:508439_1